MPENSAKYIRKLRQERGLTQSQMAADGGICLPTQQNYEAGKRLPSSRYLQSLAHKGYDIVYLLTGQHQQSLSAKPAGATPNLSLETGVAESGKAHTINSNIHENLEAIRVEYGMTQIEMAAIGGVSVNTQFNYEHGITYPSGSYLKALAEQGFDIVFIVTGLRRQAVLDSVETELLKAWYQASPELQRAALRVLMVQQTDKNGT